MFSRKDTRHYEVHKRTPKIKDNRNTDKITANKRKHSFEERDYLKKKATHEKREQMFKFSKYEAVTDVFQSIIWLIENALFAISAEWDFNKLLCLLFMSEVALIPFGIDILASILIPDFTMAHYFVIGILLFLVSHILQYTFTIYRTFVVLIGTGFYSFVITTFSKNSINKIYDKITVPSITTNGGSSGIFQDGLDIEINTIGIIVFLNLWLAFFVTQNRIRRYHPRL